MSKETKKTIGMIFKDLYWKLKQKEVDLEDINSDLDDLEVTIDETMSEEYDAGYEEGYSDGYDDCSEDDGYSLEDEF